MLNVFSDSVLSTKFYILFVKCFLSLEFLIVVDLEILAGVVMYVF